MTDIKIHRPHIQNHNLKPKSQVEDTTKYIPGMVKEFAKSMESEFAKLMINEMNKTVPKQGTDSASKFYEGLMTNEKAKAMAARDGGGIQEMILNQIYPEHLRNKQNYDFHTKSKVPQKSNHIDMHDHPTRPNKIALGQYSGDSHE